MPLTHTEFPRNVTISFPKRESCPLFCLGLCQDALPTSRHRQQLRSAASESPSGPPASVCLCGWRVPGAPPLGASIRPRHPVSRCSRLAYVCPPFITVSQMPFLFVLLPIMVRILEWFFKNVYVIIYEHRFRLAKGAGFRTTAQGPSLQGWRSPSLSSCPPGQICFRNEVLGSLTCRGCCRH